MANWIANRDNTGKIECINLDSVHRISLSSDDDKLWHIFIQTRPFGSSTRLHVSYQSAKAAEADLLRLVDPNLALPYAYKLEGVV